jgi:hypothetical protein
VIIPTERALLDKPLFVKSERKYLLICISHADELACCHEMCRGSEIIRMALGNKMDQMELTLFLQTFKMHNIHVQKLNVSKKLIFFNK